MRKPDYVESCRPDDFQLARFFRLPEDFNQSNRVQVEDATDVAFRVQKLVQPDFAFSAAPVRNHRKNHIRAER